MRLPQQPCAHEECRRNVQLGQQRRGHPEVVLRAIVEGESTHAIGGAAFLHERDELREADEAIAATPQGEDLPAEPGGIDHQIAGIQLTGETRQTVIALE